MPNLSTSVGNEFLDYSKLSDSFDGLSGEESECKANFQQVAIDMRNARTEENTLLYSIEEWL